MPATEPRRTIVFLSQVYVPDPAAVGQYLADAATELAARGHRVIVYTAREGYDDPGLRYPAQERLHGVEVRRVRFGSLGKGSIALRLLSGMLFLALASLRTLLLPRIDVIVVSTSPPMAAMAGWLISVIRGARLKLWLMDINPDQMVVLGKARPSSLPVRLFDAMMRLAIRRAEAVIVLDRFMADRVRPKHDPGPRLHVIPLWPLPEHMVEIPTRETNPFRKRHHLEPFRVVMYSGNHGLTNPLSTLLEATRAFRDDPRVVFLFVGGGVGKIEVEPFLGGNVRELPYQPLADLPSSLGAADVHVVSLGDSAIGVLHPCKIYGAMAIGRPVLLLGPARSHLAEMVEKAQCGWRVDHGDVAGAERVLREILDAPMERLVELGGRGRALVKGDLGRAALTARLCEVLAA